MKSDQKKHLLGRLSDAYSKHRYSAPNPKEPAAVAAARRILRKWQDKKSKETNKHVTKVTKAREKAMQAILFGDTNKALKAVETFEKMKF